MILSRYNSMRLNNPLSKDKPIAGQIDIFGNEVQPTNANRYLVEAVIINPDDSHYHVRKVYHVKSANQARGWLIQKYKGKGILIRDIRITPL